MLKIAIESLDVPTHMVEAGQLRSGKQIGVQKRGNQTAPAETVSINENYPDSQGCFFVGILDLAQIVTLCELSLDPGTHVFPGRNDEVGLPEQDFKKSGAVVET